MLKDYRVNTHKQYFVIANEHRKLYEKMHSEIINIENADASSEDLDETIRKIFNLYEEREKSAAIAITFSGMCLEAFLYDYAASELGDRYVLKYLDKLDVVSKALIYPKLVCGKQIDTSGSTYNHIKMLQKNRNSLVHFKSKRFDMNDLSSASDYHDLLNAKNKQGTKSCTKAIEFFVKDLDVFHGKNGYFYNSVCVW